MVSTDVQISKAQKDMLSAGVLREGFLEVVVLNGVPKDKGLAGGQTCREGIPNQRN